MITLTFFINRIDEKKMVSNCDICIKMQFLGSLLPREVISFQFISHPFFSILDFMRVQHINPILFPFNLKLSYFFNKHRCTHQSKETNVT